MRMWRDGSASPCHGEGPGPIPGIRSQAVLAQLVEALPQKEEVPSSNLGCGTQLSGEITAAPVCVYRAVRLSPPIAPGRANRPGAGPRC